MKKKPWSHSALRPAKTKSVIILAAVMLFSKSLGAANITLEYSGVLDRVESSISSYFFPGDRFSGSVTYSTTDYNGMYDDDPYAYWSRLSGFHDAVTEFSMNIGDFNFYVANVGIVQIYNDGKLSTAPYRDHRMDFSLGITVSQTQYEISPEVWNFIDESAGPLAGGLHMDDVHLSLSDWTSSLFADESLPTSFPGFDAFTKKTMLGSFYESGGGYGLGGYVGSIFGTLTAMEVVSHVPLPASIWLFSFGLVGIAGLARRKA